MSAILSSCCRSLAARVVSRSATTALSSTLLRPSAVSVAANAHAQAPAMPLAATLAALRLQHQSNQVRSYQVRASIKPRCEHCYMVMRKGRRYILCKKVARHKQRQG